MNEKEVLLPFGKTIYQSEYGHGITNDSALLVETVLKNHTEKSIRVLDLGTGNGIIAIMLAFYRKNWSIFGLEIQKKLVDLANRNKDKIKLENITFINRDLNNFSYKQKFDLIVSNPPFYALNEGKISPITERAIARHEIKTDMKNILLCISRNLSTNGLAYLIYPHKRLKELETEIKNIDLKTTEKKIISQKTKLILLYIKKVNYDKN